MATTTVKTKKTEPKSVKVEEMSVGDVFSEVSHYTYLGKNGKGQHSFEHHGSKTEVTLGDLYIEGLLKTAHQYHKEVEVGKEDKIWTAKRLQEATAAGEFKNVTKLPNEGDVMVPGIRTLWENIHSAHVFQVCYQKQDVPLSTKKLTELRSVQIESAVKELEKAQKAKKGIAAAAEEQIKKIQENPILPFEPGEMRTLVGYKVQFTSRDGRYDCVDMEIAKGENNIRPVNINTLAWLVFDGVKYIVK